MRICFLSREWDEKINSTLLSVSKLQSCLRNNLGLSPSLAFTDWKQGKTALVVVSKAKRNTPAHTVRSRWGCQVWYTPPLWVFTLSYANHYPAPALYSTQGHASGFDPLSSLVERELINAFPKMLNYFEVSNSSQTKSLEAFRHLLNRDEVCSTWLSYGDISTWRVSWFYENTAHNKILKCNWLHTMVAVEASLLKTILVKRQPYWY